MIMNMSFLYLASFIDECSLTLYERKTLCLHSITQLFLFLGTQSPRVDAHLLRLTKSHLSLFELHKVFVYNTLCIHSNKNVICIWLHS